MLEFEAVVFSGIPAATLICAAAVDFRLKLPSSQMLEIEVIELEMVIPLPARASKDCHAVGLVKDIEPKGPDASSVINPEIENQSALVTVSTTMDVELEDPRDRTNNDPALMSCRTD